MGLSAMGSNLSEAEFKCLAQTYADPKRSGNVLWNEFLLDIEIGRHQLVFFFVKVMSGINSIEDIMNLKILIEKKGIEKNFDNEMPIFTVEELFRL